jgi:hypothetical protein
MQKRYIIQLRTDPAFDVIDTTTGLVVSVWNSENAAAIDAATRLVIDLRDARRAAKEQRKGRANEVAPHSEFATTNKRLDTALRLMIR